MRWSSWAILLSIGVHAGAAVGVALIPRDVAKKTRLVAVVEKKKKDKKADDDQPAKAEEPPPPPPKPVTPPKPKPAPKAPENTPPPPPANTPPPSAAAAHPQLAALPNLGISMAGGPGAGGIAVPIGPVGADPGAAAARGGEAPKAAAKPKDECSEDAVKPKMIGAISQGPIIAAAQAAGGVEGKIRLEILVDETGNVTSVRVTSGLGGAIDEAAIAAARRVKVTPSTRCGRPVAGRLVVAITVRNPD